MADYNKLLQVPRGTKARLEQIKLDLLVNTIVYATDTKELGIKLSDGNIEYFKNATDIDAIVDNLDLGDKNVQSDWNATSGDAFIKNKPTIPSISGLATETYVNNAVANKVDTTDIVDNLTTDVATKVLSAKQGKVLNDTIGNIDAILNSILGV